MAVTYSTTPITGYNATPPSDDGSQTAANQVEWDKHKTKLGDPVKTALETSETNTATAFNSCVGNTNDTQQQMGGVLGFATSELTIASASITPTRSLHSVDTESDAASDDLDTVNTGSMPDGAIFTLYNENAARVVNVRDAVDNIFLAQEASGTFALDTTDKSITFQRRGSNIFELGRAAFAGNTTAGVSKRAIKADLETPTSTNFHVPPSMLVNHPAIPKAWVIFNGGSSGDLTIEGFDGSVFSSDSSYGGSVSTAGTGNFTWTTGVTMASSTYLVVAYGFEAANLIEVRVNSQSTTQVVMETRDQGGTLVDADNVGLVIYGQLA